MVYLPEMVKKISSQNPACSCAAWPYHAGNRRGDTPHGWSECSGCSALGYGGILHGGWVAFGGAGPVLPHCVSPL